MINSNSLPHCKWRRRRPAKPQSATKHRLGRP